MIIRRIKELLAKRGFISIATCDFKARPNVAPKFFLKLEGNFIYLVDHVSGSKTFENLKINPRVSISIMDVDSLIGYQINGSVEIIEKGQDYDSLLSESEEKEISLSTKRIIEGIDSGRKHDAFEIALSEKIVVFKVKVEEVIEISSRGELKRERF